MESPGGPKGSVSTRSSRKSVCYGDPEDLVGPRSKGGLKVPKGVGDPVVTEGLNGLRSGESGWFEKSGRSGSSLNVWEIQEVWKV